ncbi:MAG: hypothetical protein A2X84_01605 [Desulfuromonadaceae bacterium GWC2_58_13]|nr:MAG: hypothetical protein A2X84_01605 [Desulfuromonadaceae bacterium GWC2_58_13]
MRLDPGRKFFVMLLFEVAGTCLRQAAGNGAGPSPDLFGAGARGMFIAVNWTFPAGWITLFRMIIDGGDFRVEKNA